jgi:hypothetical protein
MRIEKNIPSIPRAIVETLCSPRLKRKLKFKNLLLITVYADAWAGQILNFHLNCYVLLRDNFDLFFKSKLIFSKK